MVKLNVDCLKLVFNELQMDKKSLHSCLLVDKEWCTIAVPILWETHSWNNNYNSEKKLFNVISSFLPPSSRQLLSNNKIKLPTSILLKHLLFNYVGLCEFPISNIIDKIIMIVLGKFTIYDNARTF